MTTIFIFRACFENTDIQQSKTIIKELAAYIGAGDANDAQTALNILSALAAEHLDKLKPVASMLRVCTWSFSFILWMLKQFTEQYVLNEEYELKFFINWKNFQSS